MQRTIQPGAVILVVVGTALGGMGCGGSDGSHDKYVGTWRYDAVTVATLNCGTGGTLVRVPTIDKIFQDGISAGIIDVSASPLDRTTTCSIGYDVKGFNAVVQPSQSCTLAPVALNFPLDVPTPATFKPLMWRFGLVEGPNIAEEIGNGSVTNVSLVDQNTGTILSGDCDYSLTARLTRVATD